MAKAAMSTKQLPLIEVAEARASDLLTEEDRQEQHQLRQTIKEAEEKRHQRWRKHNAGRFNVRECPCANCVRLRRTKR